jgi:hypothetical protein
MSRKDFIDAEYTVVEPGDGTTTSRHVETRGVAEVFFSGCVALALSRLHSAAKNQHLQLALRETPAFLAYIGTFLAILAFTQLLLKPALTALFVS